MPFNGFTVVGPWNASTNDRALIRGRGINGDAYRVTVAGSTDLGQAGSWEVDDIAFFALTGWVRIPASFASASYIAVDSVAAAAAVATDYARVQVAGYYAGSTEGGGMLAHQPASVETVDNGLVFPAIVGRFRRLAGERLLSDDFGIKKSGIADMSVRVQDWLDACWGEKCAAVISAGSDTTGIDCAGGTIYINTTGDVNGAAPNGFTMYGEHQRYSVLGKAGGGECLLSIGAVGTITGSGNAAGKVNFSRWHHQGHIHCWNLQTGPWFQNIRITPNSALLPAYAGNYPGVDWNYGWLASQCNHMEMFGVRLEPAPGSQGAFFTGAGNYQWRGGGVQGMDRGVVARADAVLPGAVGVAKISLQGLHFESVINECIVLEDADQGNISDNHIRGVLTPHTGTSLIRIGNTAVASSTCQNVVIDKNWMFGSVTLEDTAIDIQRCIKVSPHRNRMQNFLYGITTLNSPGTGTPVSGYDREAKNQFVNVTNKVALTAATTRARHEPADTAPVALSASTLAWNLDVSPVATLGLVGAGKTMPNPTNYLVGETYTLFITVAAAAAGITTWGSMFVFDGLAPGTGPTFAAAGVTTTQFVELTLKCVNIGGADYLSASYAIKGT